MECLPHWVNKIQNETKKPIPMKEIDPWTQQLWFTKRNHLDSRISLRILGSSQEK